jgi:hypothetical protein
MLKLQHKLEYAKNQYDKCPISAQTTDEMAIHTCLNAIYDNQSNNITQDARNFKIQKLLYDLQQVQQNLPKSMLEARERRVSLYQAYIAAHAELTFFQVTAKKVEAEMRTELPWSS